VRLCALCPQEIESRASYCPFCGARAEAVRRGVCDPLVGRSFADRYLIEQRLGAGGMGVVYQAQPRGGGEPIALKLLNQRSARDPIDVARFRREARAASLLDHPNSVQVLDFGESAGGTPFIAMELVKGESLGERLHHQGPLDERQAARITKLICSALAEAHALGVVHRDLKPENVVLSQRGEMDDYVKVLDFGLAKLMARDGEDLRTLTAEGIVCGTPEYMAPETVMGHPVDGRTDIYSLGVMLYALVCGCLPFYATNAAQIAAMQVLSKPIPPRDAAPELGISEAMEVIILRCLEKRPESRFASALDLAAALHPIAWS